MEWLTSIRKAIEFMEENLENNISVQDVGEAVCISPMFLQKGFTVMTGYGISEYLRNRRLYQAALDIITTDEKIIDIAYKYAYETPESFTKAFTRFHGFTPSQIRMGEAHPKKFVPLKISIKISGGYDMECRIVPMFGLKLIGFEKEFTYENNLDGIPKFWDEIFEKYAKNTISGGTPSNPQEQALVDNSIGNYGVCIDDAEKGKLRYLIAGKYAGGEVPEGMSIYEFPRGDWAVFECVGPMPDALQSMTDRIFNEWLPGNPDYELDGNANVEWYDPMMMDNTDPNYHSAVWIPVKKKN